MKRSSGSAGAGWLPGSGNGAGADGHESPRNVAATPGDCRGGAVSIIRSTPIRDKSGAAIQPSTGDVVP